MLDFTAIDQDFSICYQVSFSYRHLYRTSNMAIEFSKLKVGDYATIEECRVHDDTSSTQVQRLMMMGLTPGTSFSVVRVAPLGDPIEIKIRGFNLSLRREEAEGIWVKYND